MNKQKFNNSGEGTCKSVLINVAITVGLIAIFAIFGSFKSGYHVDEIFTFSLSNHQFGSTNTINPVVENGVIYSGEEIWLDYVTLENGEAFDYANVFENQANDVHPPLYYILVHTLTSLFPNLSLMLIGLLINIPLACICYWQLVWIAGKLGVKRWLSLLLTATYVLSMGFIDSAVVFFRMYALMTVWFNFLLMLFLKYKPKDKGTGAYYIFLGLISLAGFLTQYYFLIFAFFICLIYAVFVVLDKKWKKLILSLVSVGVAAIVGVAIFPWSVIHILFSYRGTEAIENALSGGLFNQLFGFCSIINSEIYGGMLPLIVLVLLISLLISWIRKKEVNIPGQKLDRLYPYAIMLMPVCLYILVVAKISPNTVMRYIIPAMGILYIAIFAIGVKLVVKWNKKAIAVVLTLAIICMGLSYRSGISNLYLDEKENIAILQENRDALCVFMYSSSWRILYNMYELKEMDSVVFIDVEQWDEFADSAYENYDSIILYVYDDYEGNHDEAIQTVMESNSMSTREELFHSWYSTVYLLK